MMKKKLIGTKRVTVSKSKRYLKNGDIRYSSSSGVMNFPEESVGESFHIEKDKNGKILISKDGKGQEQVVRKSGAQKVITIGPFIEETSEFECYRIDSDYVLIPTEGNRRGRSHEIVRVKEHVNKQGQRRRFITISKRMLEQIGCNATGFIKIYEEYKPEFKMEITAAEDCKKKLVEENSITRYLKYDGTGKTMNASEAMFLVGGIKIGDELMCKVDETEKKIVLKKK